MAALDNPCENQAKQALNVAPSSAQYAKIRLAAKRSANPLSANTNVPKINPSCTALVSSPISEILSPHARLKSSAALFALNHSDVPNNCASAIVATGVARQIGTDSELSIGVFAVSLNFQQAPVSIRLIRSLAANKRCHSFGR